MQIYPQFEILKWNSLQLTLNIHLFFKYTKTEHLRWHWIKLICYIILYVRSPSHVVTLDSGVNNDASATAEDMQKNFIWMFRHSMIRNIMKSFIISTVFENVSTLTKNISSTFYNKYNIFQHFFCSNCLVLFLVKVIWRSKHVG